MSPGQRIHIFRRHPPILDLLNAVPTNGAVPHISLVFRETWDRTNLNIFAFERQDLRKGALGNWIRSQRSKPKHENKARCPGSAVEGPAVSSGVPTEGIDGKRPETGPLNTARGSYYSGARKGGPAKLTLTSPPRNSQKSVFLVGVPVRLFLLQRRRSRFAPQRMVPGHGLKTIVAGLENHR